MRLWIAWTFTFVVLLAAAVVWARHHPLPTKIIVATGSKNLAYYNFGKRYSQALKGKVEVEVQETNGSPDNVDRLRTKRADIALIQGGIIGTSTASNLESLGTVFYEPMWLFRRRDAGARDNGSLREMNNAAATQAKACGQTIFRPATPPRPSEGINSLRGKKIAVGLNDSGIQVLACKLLRRHGITWRVADIEPKSTKEAVAALRNGNIDAAFIVASWDAPDVQILLHDDRIEVVGYPQADAYADRYSYLHKVVLHHGAIDLAKDKPEVDVPLVAVKASLIVRNDLHPAIQYLLLNAARPIHSKRGVLQGGADEFPSVEAVVPLSAMAQQFYNPNLPYYLNDFLMKYLPFSIAGPIVEPINELLIPVLLVIGTLGVLTPLGHLVVIIYTWFLQRPVSQLLRKVMNLEKKLDTRKENARQIAFELDGVEDQVIRHLRRHVPAALVAPLLVLRHQHIDALRKRLEQYTGSVAEPAPEALARSSD